MAYDDSAEVSKINTIPLSLKPSTVEKVSTDCVTDLGPIVVLDGIDIQPDEFPARCHDLHGSAERLFKIKTNSRTKSASSWLS
jgi:hypothetical protein